MCATSGSIIFGPHADALSALCSVIPYPPVSAVVLSAFYPGRSAADLLLPGNITANLRVTVMNAAGVTVSAPAVPVTVRWPDLPSREAEQAFIAQSADSARTAALTGQPGLSVALIGGTATLLNTLSGRAAGENSTVGSGVRRRLVQVDAASAAIEAEARSAARDSLGDAILEAVSVIHPTADALQSVSAAVSAIASEPAELSPSAQATLLSVLSLVATGGPVGASGVTNGSALECASAAGLIARAAQLQGSAVRRRLLHSTRLGDIRGGSRRALLSEGSGEGVGSAEDTARAAPHAPSQADVLGGVMSVLGGLSDSLRAQLAVPGEAAVSVSADRVQLSVRLSDPGLGALGFSAPGAPAAFDPLPQSALDALAIATNGSAVVSSFLALAFSPYPDDQATSPDGAAAGAASEQPVARLALTAASGGAEIPLRNLPQHITFEMPHPAGVAEGFSAQCRFWCATGASSTSNSPSLASSALCVLLPLHLMRNFLLKGSCHLSARSPVNPPLFHSLRDAAAGALSSEGCTALPSPRPKPALLSLTWRGSTAGATVAADLWTVSGPLSADCQSLVLDCGANPLGRVWLDPLRPMTYPAVTCQPPAPPNATISANSTSSISAPSKAPTAAILRVFFGEKCQLWRPDNAEGCFWLAERQAFVGPGCVRAERLGCSCSHATDFLGGRAPQVRVATLAQMRSLQPTDLVTKLRVRQHPQPYP